MGSLLKRKIYILSVKSSINPKINNIINYAAAMNRACEPVPKSQVKIGQKLKLKVKIGTWKNFGSNFFINIDKKIW